MRHPIRTSTRQALAGATCASALAVLMIADFAAAQQPTQAQAAAIRQSCRSDFEAHCKGVPTGGQEALACLKRNAGASSEGCQRALAAAGGAAATPGSSGAAPPSGAAPAARGTPPPGGTTPPGGAPQSGGAPGGMERASPRDEIRIVRNNCQADYRTHCAGTPLGEGRAVACLKANASALSPGCQNALLSLRQ